ncbi:hypothetical protein AQ611_12355 [Burkholderia singularis]|nr:hypothetical protein AQ611_12355 [Burkholderia sp. Bp7605]
MHITSIAQDSRAAAADIGATPVGRTSRACSACGAGKIGRSDRFARRRVISHSPRARRAANRPANIDSISEANGLTAYGCVNHSRLAKRTRQARSARCVDSGGAWR